MIEIEDKYFCKFLLLFICIIIVLFVWIIKIFDLGFGLDVFSNDVGNVGYFCELWFWDVLVFFVCVIF